MNRRITGTQGRALRGALRYIKPYAGFKLAMIIIPVLRQLDTILNDIDEAIKPYETEMDALIYKHAKLGNGGAPERLPDGRVPIVSVEEFQKEKELLETKWADDIKEHERVLNDYYEVFIPDIHEDIINDKVRDVLSGDLLEVIYDYIVFCSPADTP